MPLASMRAAVAGSKSVFGVSTGCGIAHSVTERRSAAIARAYDRARVGTEVGLGGTVAGDRRQREPELTTQYGPLRVDLEGRVAHVVIDHPPLQLVDGSLLMGL